MIGRRALLGGRPRTTRASGATSTDSGTPCGRAASSRARTSRSSTACARARRRRSWAWPRSWSSGRSTSSSRSHRWRWSRRPGPPAPSRSSRWTSRPIRSPAGSSPASRRPGGNVTGLFLDFPELAGKWLELMREAVPSLSRVAVLWDPATGPAQMKAAETAARTLRLQIQVLPARAAADLDAAVQAAVKERAGALVVLSSPVFNAARRQVATLTGRSRLPSIMAFPGYAEDGGLIGYGPHLRSMFAQAGRHVVRVLKGAAPREIPVERPTQFALLINQTTAQALGVTIPPSLLARADEVIQR
ncbi:MAG TPA: ABC transporter substrate-binding protein [Candidatus Dormibacteraeota bacterium]|nr:ABC transporter substrate-binding protein [Candidatus Dormibacteraeota bacterium]